MTTKFKDNQVDIASIEAQMDSTVPYYVFDLITEIKLNRALIREQAETITRLREAVETLPRFEPAEGLDDDTGAYMIAERFGKWILRDSALRAVGPPKEPTWFDECEENR